MAMARRYLASTHQRILQMAGWTSDEIQLLVTNRTCPDHWYADPRPTFALVEAIRDAVHTCETLSLRKDFVPILQSMGLKEPKIALATLSSKIKRKVAKAEKTGNWMDLCSEKKDLTTQKDLVGASCDLALITPQWLQEGTALPVAEITNRIVAELFHYRRTRAISWKTVLEVWWPKLFPEQVTPPMGTVINSWKSVVKKKTLLSRDSSMIIKDNFLNTLYVYPTPKPAKPAMNIAV